MPQEYFYLDLGLAFKELLTTGEAKIIQGDQKVSERMTIYCNRQVHRNFLITR
jgi:hypothetical protein